METKYPTKSFLVGMLQSRTDAQVNMVNVSIIAREMGISPNELRNTEIKDYPGIVIAEVETDRGSHSIRGTVFGQSFARIVAIDDYHMEIKPEGDMVVLYAIDKPGVIGNVGTHFGKHNVNIAQLAYGRKQAAGDSVICLTLDSKPSTECLDELVKEDFVKSVYALHLPPLQEG
jgi:D-3-phosphoglycerate dehydrogenase